VHVVVRGSNMAHEWISIRHASVEYSDQFTLCYFYYYIVLGLQVDLLTVAQQHVYQWTGHGTQSKLRELDHC